MNPASSTAAALVLLQRAGEQEKSTKSDISKIVVTESVNWINNSRSSKSFRPGVSYSDSSVKMRWSQVHFALRNFRFKNNISSKSQIMVSHYKNKCTLFLRMVDVENSPEN